MLGSTLQELALRDAALAPIFREVLTLSAASGWPALGDNLPACYIINTETRKNGPGEHWVAVYVSEEKSCDYFDSYGTGPLENIYKWMKKMRLQPIRYNKKWLQAPTSQACGAYCLYFLRARARGMSLEKILGHFREGDFPWNESLVRGQSSDY